MDETPILTWELRPSGATLRIHYTVQNRSAAPIYLMDQILAPGDSELVLMPLAVVVRDGPTEGEVLLTKGYVRAADQQVGFHIVPGVRKLDSGASLSGDAELRMPLEPWHPNAFVKPLRSPRRTAVLEVGYLREPGEIRPLRLDDGSYVDAAKSFDAIVAQRLLRGEALPLPAGA